MRRVVVTGVGVVSPIGNSPMEAWNNAIEGKSGIGPITLFNAEDAPVKFAGEVKGFDVSQPLPEPLYPRGKNEPALINPMTPKDSRRVGRFSHFAMAAGLQAYKDAGLDSIRDQLDATSIGINIGVGMGGLPEIEQVHGEFMETGYKRITPFFITQSIPNLAAGMLSIALNIKGPNLCVTTACASSAHSIGESFNAIRRGDVDLMIAGGSESVICKLGIGGFAALRALSTRNDAPQAASRPYDKDRDGFVMGEGSTIMILEEYEHAKRRGAKIYGEIVGYGLSGDAYHVTALPEGGEGGARAMKMALKSAGLAPEQIDYVNAHATSTPVGDVGEAQGIRAAFTKKDLLVSSTKSMTGHLLGAAGAMEGFFTMMAIEKGIVPATINLDNLDPKCAETGLNFVANHAVKAPLQYAASNSFGFGGTNACLIFGKV